MPRESCVTQGILKRARKTSEGVFLYLNYIVKSKLESSDFLILRSSFRIGSVIFKNVARSNVTKGTETVLFTLCTCTTTGILLVDAPAFFA